MQTDADVGKLIEALALAQRAFKPLERVLTAGKGDFAYDYADLSQYIAATRDALNANGLCVLQTVTPHDKGWLLVTTLWHKSGVHVDSSYPLTVTGNMQARGSELTYARKYMYAAITGIHPESEDDDGAKAPERKPERKSEPWRQQPPAVVPASKVQLEHIAAMALKHLGLKKPDLPAWIADHLGRPDYKPGTLTITEAEGAVELLTRIGTWLGTVEANHTDPLTVLLGAFGEPVPSLKDLTGSMMDTLEGAP